jgi:hypothetical protein
MTKLGFSFDAMSIEPSKGFEVLPPGDYRVMITNSEMRDTASGAGKYLWLDMMIVDGQYQGQHLFDLLNLVNPNEVAVRIAYESLSAICRAVGVLNTDDASDLYNRSMIAVVKVKPAGPDKTGTHREAKNEVKAYKAVPEAGGNTARPSANTAAPVKAAASAPWKR